MRYTHELYSSVKNIMAVTSVCFKFSLFAAMFVALVCTDVAKAQKNSGLAAALAGYLRPAAVAAEQRIRACNGQGDQVQHRQ